MSSGDCPSDHVSLDKFLEIYYNTDRKIDNIEARYKKIIKNKLNAFYVSLSYYFSSNKVKVDIVSSIDDTDGEYTFKIIDGDLQVIKIDSKKPIDNILQLIGNDMMKYYNDISSYEGFALSFGKNIDGVRIFANSIMGFSCCIKIYDKKSKIFEIKKDFEKGTMEINCNSLKVTELLKGKEDYLFKKIYISKKDCPSFVLDELEKEEKEQEIQRLYQEKLILEQKRKEAKRKALIKKFIPFYKK